ncbi:hypothetical protein B0T26DRAFT_723604 [Lasiosphaeria miniovina]|uniref:Uncharacterized protein n=1 Tax=Lasiosphaeria miniovina TaxID=1954250 RepID=A0AA40DNQ6_9PEZI|nr:uncharacterized protein B0T26DRAFT_723604 [Lasiosphaeria miniovina]KAK0709955.1 hypothetical protein B0T26DRAFT_723604 [Lasiosphaeria miniovina]
MTLSTDYCRLLTTLENESGEAYLHRNARHACSKSPSPVHDSYNGAVCRVYGKSPCQCSKLSYSREASAPCRTCGKTPCVCDKI